MITKTANTTVPPAGENVLPFPKRSWKDARQDASRRTLARQGSKRKKSNDIIVEKFATSRMVSPETRISSRPFTQSAKADLDQVASTSIRKLAKEHPREWNSFKGMGVRVRSGKYTCAPELATFKGFLTHLPLSPGEGYTLDHINPADPEYAPDKVQWADKRQQANNRGVTIFLPYRGKMVPLSVVAERTGQKPDTMRHRLRKGWTPVEVVAGNRLPAQPSEALTTETWPTFATYALWENNFKAWRGTIGSPAGATRAVFFSWVANSQRVAALGALERDFPEFYDPERADPEDDTPLPDEVTSHPAYTTVERLTLALMEYAAIIRESPAQNEMLASLRRERDPIDDPAKARDAMRRGKTRSKKPANRVTPITPLTPATPVRHPLRAERLAKRDLLQPAAPRPAITDVVITSALQEVGHRTDAAAHE